MEIKSKTKWEIGDTIDISENQKSLINEASAVSILNPIVIPNYDNSKLEIKIREFLSFYTGLCVKYIRENEKIQQEVVAPSDIKIQIDYRKINKNLNKDLERDGMSFLKKKCNFFEGELIRMIVYDYNKKNDKRILVIGIHYSLIDMYTNMTLSRNLYNFFNDKPINTNYISNFEYVCWQKSFLSSTLGHEKRKFWETLLIPLEFQSITDIESTIKSSEREFVIQKKVLKGRSFKHLKSIVKKTNLPLSAFLLSLHQKLIREVFKTGDWLQLIRVHGREKIIDTLDINNVLGMVANSIPLPVVLSPKLSNETLLDIYINYCSARLHQHVPFEIIKKDFEEKKEVDINSHIAGLFNFVSLEQKKKRYSKINFFQKNTHTSKKELPSSEKPLNLYCTLYQNSLELEMRCKYDFYKRNKEKLNLSKALNKGIKF